MNISPMCAVELLEIIKYLDDELKKNIPQGFETYLNSIKDNNYHFEINKNINLFENDFMDETTDVLMTLTKNHKKSPTSTSGGMNCSRLKKEKSA